jgi:hypothetical protein
MILAPVLGLELVGWHSRFAVAMPGAIEKGPSFACPSILGSVVHFRRLQADVVPIAERGLRHGVRQRREREKCFPAASSRRPRALYSSFVSSLRRVEFFVCLWLVTQLLVWWQETACRDSSYDPAAASCGGTPLGSDLFNKALN